MAGRLEDDARWYAQQRKEEAARKKAERTEVASSRRSSGASAADQQQLVEPWRCAMAAWEQEQSVRQLAWPFERPRCLRVACAALRAALTTERNKCRG